jgi:hypothetical protein
MAIAKAVDRYRRLSPPARRALWTALAAEAARIAVIERDIHRRPAERIRGPKPLWRLFATQNFVGPAAYYALGRRRHR